MTSELRVKAIGRILAALMLILAVAISAQAQETVTGVQDIPGFDHSEMADFPLTGQHAEIICESCHINNQLAGTPRTCAGCHDGDRAAGKPADHPPAGNDCAQCHTTTNFEPFAFSHAGITSGCAECHNGARAPGKPANHPPASNDCAQCHTTNNFIPFDFDHSAIQQDCTACHNGSTARGQPADHISVAASCDNCHVTTAFTDVRMEHSVVGGNCVDCHNNTVATGQPDDHIPVFDQDCASCHSTFVFTGGIFDHTLFEQGCATCHDNEIALGKPVDHLPAPETCNDCHSPYFEQTFASVNFDHDVVPGDCASCHFQGNPWDAPFQPADHPPVSQDCAECHSTFAFSVGQDFSHTEITGPCADCHYSGNPFGADAMPPGHENTSMTCDGCHMSTDAFFAAVMFDHNETNLLCANCHLDPVFWGPRGALTTPPPHTEDVGECSDCHLDTVAFANVMMNHNADTDNCVACHIGNPTFWGAPTYGDAALPSFHSTSVVSGADCGDCHGPNEPPSIPQLHLLSWTDVECSTCHAEDAGAPDLPDFHTSSVITTDMCSSCHSVSEPPSVPVLHNLGFTSVECQTCHTEVAAAPDLPDFHASAGVTSNDCTFCHDAGEPPTPNMNHIGFDNLDCVECHYTYQSSTLDPNNPDSMRQTHDSGDNCTSCHAQPF